MKRLFTLIVSLTVFVLGAGQVLAGDDSHGGDIHYDKPVTGVLFSHQYHVEEMGFDCESCHDGLFEMEALAAQEDLDFTMKGLEDGLYCGACHEGSMAFAANTRCASCHEGVKGYNRVLGLPEAGGHDH